MKKLWKAFITNLSKLGRAMLVPIVAMPAIGILGRLGAADMLNIPLMETASNAITNNLDMLFAFGACLAFAKAKDKTFPMIGAAVGLFAFKACLSSLNEDIELFSRAVRGHWSVESMHWQLDVTFKEDANRTLDKQAAENLNIIRKWSLSILKPAQITRHKLSMRKKRFVLSLRPIQYLEELLEA